MAAKSKTSAPKTEAQLELSGESAKQPEKPAAKPKTSPRAVKPSGVIPIFLLKDGVLGARGAIVRVSKRKLGDLELEEGADWSRPTDAQLAIGG
jgi:hypothetical protein